MNVEKAVRPKVIDEVHDAVDRRLVVPLREDPPDERLGLEFVPPVRQREFLLAGPQGPSRLLCFEKCAVVVHFSIDEIRSAGVPTKRATMALAGLW